MWRQAALFTVSLTMGLAACGGGDGTPSAAPATTFAPPAAPPAAATVSPERLAAIAAVSSLLSAPVDYFTLASATVGWDHMYSFRAPTYSFLAPGQCAQSGFRQILLDGAPWYTQFPTGKHSLAAQFDSCKFSGPMQDLLLNGSVDLVYEMSAPENVSATLTLKQFTADTLLPSFQADGPASYTVERSDQVDKNLIDLRPGATLTNAKTTNRIDFTGGRYSFVDDRSAQPATSTEEYLQVTLNFNGVRYVLDGRVVQRSSGPTLDCTGEIRITDGNGALAARRYCVDGRVEYELVKPIPVF